MEITAHSEPFKVFEAWMTEARKQPHIKEPTAMSLATVGGDGDVHARIVLCKQWSTEGLVFFTNYDSRKGLDLQHNPNAAAVFYWDPMFRQVKFSGQIEKTSRQVSEQYWRTRARDSQISQTISRQSQEAPAREVMQQEWQQAEERLHGKDIPCPAHWGGYLLRPKRIEFWLGQPGRWHDRHEFQKSSDRWTYRRLYP